jgi:LuxR family quorum sensing-dependent transcriptional regulator
MDFGRDAFDFIERLEQLPSIGAVMDATAETLAGYGFEYFMFGGVARSSADMPGIVLAHRTPGELLKLYVERRYADVDPVMRRLLRTSEPFRWLDVPHDQEREPKAAELAKLVRDFGLAQAFLVPIPSPAGTYGNVWMAGPKPNLTPRTWPALHLMGLYAFDRVHRLVGPLPDHRSTLTAREREVLTWLATGKSSWEIGEILGIAKRTVDEHCQTLERKLSAGNRPHAVAIALRNRLIEI